MLDRLKFGSLYSVCLFNLPGCVTIPLYLLYNVSDARPVVTVSFVTEFDGHISVAMDAELIMWLHDVVTSYVREKDTQKSEYYDTLQQVVGVDMNYDMIVM